MLKKLVPTPSSNKSSLAQTASKAHSSQRSFSKKAQDMDLTDLFQAPQKCGYTTSSQSCLTSVTSLSPRKKDTGFEIIERQEVNSEFKKVEFALKKRGARFAMPLASMYKYISYNAYEARLTDYDSTGEDRSVLLLDVKTKDLDSDAPLILYCHGSHRDLGSLSHYFADFASQMKAEIVAFELPNFGPHDNPPSSKMTQNLIMSYAEIAFDYVRSLLLQDSRKIFIYGQGSGAIPAVELASVHCQEVSGLILQDAIIEFKKKKGLIFKRLVREDRYLKVIGELDRVSVLLFHGTQGNQAPFSYAQTIMDKLFNGNNGKKTRSVVEERKVQSQVAGKSVMRNTSILENIIGKKKKQRYRFEGYFVECDNGEVMNLKRSTYYSVLRDFIIDVEAMQAQNLEIMLNPFDVASQKLYQTNKSPDSSPLNSSRSLYKYQKTLQQDSGFMNLSLMRLQSCEEQDQSKEDESPFDHAVSSTNVLAEESPKVERQLSPVSPTRKKLLYEVKEMLLEGKASEADNFDSYEHNISTSPGTKEGTPKAIEDHKSFLKLRRGNFPAIRQEWQLKDEEGIRSFLSSKMSDSENLKEQEPEGEANYGRFLKPVALINPRKQSSLGAHN